MFVWSLSPSLCGAIHETHGTHLNLKSGIMVAINTKLAQERYAKIKKQRPLFADFLRGDEPNSITGLALGSNPASYPR